MCRFFYDSCFTFLTLAFNKVMVKYCVTAAEHGVQTTILAVLPTSCHPDYTNYDKKLPFTFQVGRLMVVAAVPAVVAGVVVGSWQKRTW